MLEGKPVFSGKRIDVLRDSLESADADDIDRDITESGVTEIRQAEAGIEESVQSQHQQHNASVLDETTGKIVKVIFDPVLKCYYEPQRNVYYQVNDVVRS